MLRGPFSNIMRPLIIASRGIENTEIRREICKKYLNDI